MEPQYFNLNSPRYEGVNSSPFALFAQRPQQLSAREGQASQADILLAINRMMGLAPARAANVPISKEEQSILNLGTPITPIIPSEQAAKEARVIYDQSGAAQADSQEEQVALVQALMQKLGLF
jgi:hypothetical protein